MIKKLKLFICLISCIVLLPSVVDAHTLSFGEASQSPGVTEIPISLKADPGIPQNTRINLVCSTSVDNVVCSISYMNAALADGALHETLPAGETKVIGKLILTNNDFSNYNGVTATIEGLGGAKATTRANVQSKQTLKTSSKLNSLSISQGKMYPAFNADTYDYTIYGIRDTIISVTFNYTCDNCVLTASGDDKIDISRGSTSVKANNLQKGDNKLSLNITSEDGSNKDTYTFRIIRGETKYNSSKLEILTIGDYRFNPEFKSDKTDYIVNVPNSVEKLIDYISYKAEDEDAEIVINGAEALVTGENKITIEVTSVNKDNTTTYNITVVRLPDDAIIVKKNKDKTIYFIDANEKEQKMTEEEFKNAYPTVWEDIKAGKYKFDKDGNVITGEEEKKEDKKSNKKTIIVVAIIVVALIIIVVSGILLFRKKDPKKEELKKEEKIKKKAQKKAEKDRLKKLEEKYYNEYSDEDEESEDEESEDEEDTEIKEEDKLSKKETSSLLEDDYIFESSIIEDEKDEEKEEHVEKSEVVDVDDALEDLMNTKTYDFGDELSNIEEEDEDEDKDE